MGLIKAFTGAISGALADQWLEVLEPDQMTGSTVFTSGVPVRQDDRRNQNRKGTSNIVSNGSKIHVYPNQFMMLVDGGRIVDYTAEEGYYTVNNSTAPSLLNGELGEALKESFNRFRYGGVPSMSQKVYFINLQEIKGIKFGTRNPINYFDNAYNAELFLRAHGTYSIKITDPLLFYQEVVDKSADRLDYDQIKDQYLSEFLEALQGAINQLSADGVRISYVPSKGRELSRYMSTILDEDWRAMRGMEVQSVGIASISYDEESTKLIHMRNQGAMLGDPNVREGYVQGAVARGLEAAGSNANGAMAGFMGMGLGSQAGGGIAGAFSQANAQQMQRGPQQPPAAQPQTAGGWTCACGAHNAEDARFCTQCGAKKPAPDGWTCPTCQQVNRGNFCSQCGAKRPDGRLKCDKCGYMPDPAQPAPKFCPECGDPFDERDRI